MRFELIYYYVNPFQTDPGHIEKPVIIPLSYLEVELNETQTNRLKILFQNSNMLPKGIDRIMSSCYFLKCPFSKHYLQLTTNDGFQWDARKIVNDLIKQAINDCKIN